MKKALSIFIVMIMVITTVALVNLVAAQSLVQNPETMFPTTEIVEKLEPTKLIEPIFQNVPVEYRDTVTQVVEQISKDPEIEAAINQQIGGAYQDILNGTSSFNEKELLDDMSAIIGNYSKEIEAITGQTITTETIRTEMESVLVGYDVQTVYETVLTEVTKNLTPRQQQVLELTRWFNSNSPLLIGVATGVLIALMVLLFVLERHYFWIPYIVGASIASAILLYPTYIVATMITKSMISRLGVQVSSSIISNTPYLITIGVLVVVAIAGIIFTKTSIYQDVVYEN
ncbi:hypothetical protein [Erysipelothrix aquatica]|uniref:hypothetical protein n=1 Tax=Erysipelothrix aquatica TaxID=2683714 RepID=UPI00135AECE6|nr:hypothetical protein [Erysipelothrix aquatica]